TSANEVREALEAFVAPSAASPARRMPVWARAVAGLAGLVGVIALLGFIACRYFEVVIGVGPDFEAGPLDYLRVGANAFFPFFVYWTAFAAFVAFIRLAIRAPLVRRLVPRTTVPSRADPVVLATLVFVAGVAGWVGITVAYRDLFFALDALRVAMPLTPAQIAVLGPGAHSMHNAHGSYSAGWSFLLLLAVFYLFPFLERP